MRHPSNALNPARRAYTLLVEPTAREGAARAPLLLPMDGLHTTGVLASITVFGRQCTASSASPKPARRRKHRNPDILRHAQKAGAREASATPPAAEECPRNGMASKPTPLPDIGPTSGTCATLEKPSLRSHGDASGSFCGAHGGRRLGLLPSECARLRAMTEQVRPRRHTETSASQPPSRT